MLVKYRVTEVNEKDGNIIVRYFTESLSETHLASLFDIDGDPVMDANGYPLRCKTDVSLTLYNNYGLKPEELHERITFAAPTTYLQHAEEIKSNNSYSLQSIMHVIGQVVEFEANTSPTV